MKARLILGLLQLLTSRKGVSALVAGCILLLVPLVLAAGMPVLVPMASDKHLAEYEAVAEALPVEVDWMAMVAIDAVRRRQDFGAVDLEEIVKTASLFMACKPVMEIHEFPFEADSVGDNLQYPLPLSHPATVSWTAKKMEGSVEIELRNSLDEPIPPGKLEDGFYSLLILATAAPAVYEVAIHIESEELVCHGKPVDQVMDELGFTGDEREMALGFMNALADKGE